MLFTSAFIVIKQWPALDIITWQSSIQNTISASDKIQNSKNIYHFIPEIPGITHSKILMQLK